MIFRDWYKVGLPFFHVIQQYLQVKLENSDFPNLKQNSLSKTINKQWCWQSFISHKARSYDNIKIVLKFYLEHRVELQHFIIILKHFQHLKLILEIQEQISKKRCVEKYCSCNKACQF